MHRQGFFTFQKSFDLIVTLLSQDRCKLTLMYTYEVFDL